MGETNKCVEREEKQYVLCSSTWRSTRYISIEKSPFGSLCGKKVIKKAERRDQKALKIHFTPFPLNK